ncbi:MAG: hypothetical protein Q7R95_01760 [bacterium]|nr:hypothetical protein [bacterium]
MTKLKRIDFREERKEFYISMEIDEIYHSPHRIYQHIIQPLSQLLNLEEDEEIEKMSLDIDDLANQAAMTALAIDFPQRSQLSIQV